MSLQQGCQRSETSLEVVELRSKCRAEKPRPLTSVQGFKCYQTSYSMLEVPAHSPGKKLESGSKPKCAVLALRLQRRWSPCPMLGNTSLPQTSESQVQVGGHGALERFTCRCWLVRRLQAHPQAQLFEQVIGGLPMLTCPPTGRREGIKVLKLLGSLVLSTIHHGTRRI